MNGRNDTATFLPLDFRIGGQNRDSHPTVGQYLTRDQVRYIYKKVQTGGNDKHRYCATGDRTRKTVEWNGNILPQ